MAPNLASSYGEPSKPVGFFVVTRTKVILFLTLIATWLLASILPTYKQTLKDVATANYHDAIEHLPALKVDWHPNYDPKTQFNSSKIALIIEGRPLPQLVPLLLHMISVVPPDWRFVFVGSPKSVISVSRSFAVQYHEANGKLDLVVLPKPFSIEDKEHVFRTLTDLRFYDEILPTAEWIMKFESDAIMCANSDDSLNNWLHYDWAGAPRTADDKFAGNGGLSLRRVSKVRQVLGFQSRHNNTQPEDEWFGKRLTNLPGAKVANAAEERYFAVEDRWHEKPMGYHVRDGGEKLADDVWKDPQRRKKNFEYCPELSMIMPMKLERERCDNDDKQGNLKEAPKPAAPQPAAQPAAAKPEEKKPA